MKVTFALFAFLLLGACSPSVNTPPPKILEEQRAVLDQAKTIEATQQQQAEEQRKAIEQQTQ